MKRLAVCVVSGGLDSIVMAYMLADQGFDLYFISFDYGQKHSKEIEYAKNAAAALSAGWDLVNLSSLAPFLRGSALTDPAVPLPIGQYTSVNMISTVVANRNAVFLSVAYMVAAGLRADAVGIGVHSGDHPIYADCRPEFIRAFEDMENLAIPFMAPRLYAPFLNLTKSQIVLIGNALNVPFEKTWSCYAGRDEHCGRCGTCQERRAAFRSACVADPTIYEIGGTKP